MFRKVLIANRGEIACRIMRTAKRLGAACVAVYSDADKGAMHTELADESYRLGAPPAAESYLRIDRIIAIAKETGVDAVHPGYGFLSESPDFAEACAKEGLTFIGPSAAAIRALGKKDAAKRLMEKAGVPVVPGYHGELQDVRGLADRAREIGYPILIKASGGGGGRGMRRIDYPENFAEALASAQREAEAGFGDRSVIIEKFVARARHIEVQIFADAFGGAVHLFERDCSLQRRHQKVVEEAPAPGMTEAVRRHMGEAAVKAARAAGYQGAGTVEFLVDASRALAPDNFYFMEMNTRLQVEHPVTEAITGQDLVEWQFRIALGEPLPLPQDQLRLSGHAIEARLYAEDAGHGFRPQTGRITHLRLAGDDARLDTGVRQGDEITSYYDPLIAKIIAQGPTREVALRNLARALDRSWVAGCTTNLQFLRELIAHPDVMAGAVETALIERSIASLTARPKPTNAAIAIAALAALHLLDEKDAPDPWSALAGWRAWGEADSFVELALEEVFGDEDLGREGRREELVSLRVVSMGRDAFRVEWADANVTCILLSRDGERLRFDVGNRILEAANLGTGSQICIDLEGTAYTFNRPGPTKPDTDRHSSSDEISSPISGLVRAVRVSAGDHVKKGAALVIIEAMKMEHTVLAPREATIAEVCVTLGDQVDQGATLLMLAEDACPTAASAR